MRIVKNILIILFLAFQISINFVYAKDFNFETTVNRSRVSLGSSVQLYLTFNDTQKIPAPELKINDEFQARYVGPSTRMSVVNGKVSSSITHVYNLLPTKTGNFKIGPFQFSYNGDNYSSTSIQIEVIDAQAAPKGNTSITSSNNDSVETKNLSDRVFVVLEPKKKNIYINEIVPLTIKLYVNKVGLRDIQFPDIFHEGFSLAELGKPKQYQDVYSGVEYEVVEFNTTFFALKSGDFKLGPAKVKCSLLVKKQQNRRSQSVFDDDFFDSGVFDDFFGRYEAYPLELKSLEIPVSVLPVPQEGRPVDFSGAIGEFDFDVSISPSEVKVGDPITLKAVIKGEGNFSTVKLPAITDDKNFKVYEAQSKQEFQEKSFEQIIMPLNDKIAEIPSLSFNFFNTKTGQYEVVSKGPFAIKVLKADKQDQVRIVEQKQVVAVLPKEEKLGRDIIFIKDYQKNIRKKGEFLYKNSIYWLIWGITFIVYVILFSIARWYKKLNNDVKYARKLKAPKKAKQRLVKARKFIAESKNKEFFDIVFETLQEYLGDKFHLSSKSLTISIINDVLQDKKVSDKIIKDIKDIFDACDMARYASSQVNPEFMKEVLKKLENVVEYF